MIDVAGYQPAKVVGIFSRAAATTLVQKESDAVHILENFLRRWGFSIACRVHGLELRASSLSVMPGQFRDLLAIHWRPFETQFLIKCLLEIENIPVLTKHQRHDNPIIPSPHLPVWPLITQEFMYLPAADVWRGPAEFF